ncbi:MAG: LruC domain-containing protein [Leadbetterella sp.]|nr:LruC domain-containing protein [Leadbetterella sp.]
MKKRIIIYSIASIGLTSCLPAIDKILEPELETTSGIEKTKVPESFDFKTSSVTTIKIKVLNGQDKPMSNIPFSIVTEPNGEILFKAVTNAAGYFETQKQLGNHVEKLSFKTDLIGIPGNVTMKIENKGVFFTIGGTKPTTGLVIEEDETRALRVGDFTGVTEMPKLKTLGTWNSSGVPSYLLPFNDNISSSFLLDISTSIPEGAKPLPVTHPDYLKENRPTTLTVKERSDVWVTFVHEGAGYKNTMGFYTFDAKNPPTTIDQIKEATIIFPNVSYAGSGGGLVSGNKVKIGTFEAGTSIGFFLLYNSYSGTTVGNGNYPLFSHSNLNLKNSEINRHFILLDDSKSNNFLLSVEDIRRDNEGSDHDFNDAVFTVSCNPIVSIEDPNIPKMDINIDSDGDGAGDTRDEFPKDPERAFRSYTPSKKEFSTLIFEDLWPSKGDYDFNDLVLDYQIEEVYNTQNKIVDIYQRSVIKAVGASFKNGFGFQLNASPDVIKKVTGSVLKNNIIKLYANGTEAGQNKAVIIPFDNVFDNIKRLGSEFINTLQNQPYSKADTLVVKIELNGPQTQSTIGVAPYNQFIFTNQQRGWEVHLQNYPPTSLANLSLFGTSHDKSNPVTNTYYKNFNNLPWAIQVPTSFEYMIEKKEITSGYLNFTAWAESGGTKYKDWYLPKPDYRNTSNIIIR